MTDALSPPPAACTPWVTLHGGLAVVLDDPTEHVRLENEALFPCVEPQAHG